MKKIVSVALVMLMTMGIMTGCGGTEEVKHKLEYVDGKKMEILYNDITLNSVSIFTKYTNSSGESAIPADNVNVKAYQNGTELSPWVFTGEKTEGYVQCDTSIQDGTTADVIWIFELEDDSEVSVEFEDGQKFTVE